MREPLQTDIASADPLAGDAHDDTKLRTVVRRASADAREIASAESAARKPWWRRRRIMVPLASAGAVALTGAAVVIPLGLWVDGTRVDLDAEIPIIYTTDTGVEVSCRYGIHFGDPASRSTADERLAEFVAGHDWTGIGQRIYDEARANPFTPGPDDDLENDNQEIRDQLSFNYAIEVLWQEIPRELLDAGHSAGGTMDCTGQLR